MKNENIIEENYQKAVSGLSPDILNDRTLWYNYIDNLPKQIQVVYTVAVFHNQVINGGFHQYFLNPYGQFAFLTLENLNLIRANRSFELLKKALNEVNTVYSSEQEFAQMVFNRKLDGVVKFEKEMFDTLTDFDREYYSNVEDIEQLLIDYLKNFVI